MRRNITPEEMREYAQVHLRFMPPKAAKTNNSWWRQQPASSPGSLGRQKAQVHFNDITQPRGIFYWFYLICSSKSPTLHLRQLQTKGQAEIQWPGYTRAGQISCPQRYRFLLDTQHLEAQRHRTLCFLHILWFRVHKLWEPWSVIKWHPKWVDGYLPCKVHGDRFPVTIPSSSTAEAMGHLPVWVLSTMVQGNWLACTPCKNSSNHSFILYYQSQKWIWILEHHSYIMEEIIVAGSIIRHHLCNEESVRDLEFEYLL